MNADAMFAVIFLGMPGTVAVCAAIYFFFNSHPHLLPKLPKGRIKRKEENNGSAD